MNQTKLIYIVLSIICASLLSSCSKNDLTEPLIEVLSEETVPLDVPFSSNDFYFLDSILKDKSIIQLGESIHITHEFPLVRNEIVKYLNANQGYDVIALEGSAIDSWIGMDYLLHASDDSAIAKAQEYAWFGLWQTVEMQEVIRTVYASLRTSHPLYMTAFDIQPSIGRLYPDQSVFDTLFSRLNDYMLFEDEPTLLKWQNDFSQLISCKGFVNASIKNSGVLKDIESSIKAFDSLWIQPLHLIVSQQKGELHGRTTRLLPDNLMDRYCHCQEVVSGSEIDYKRYQIKRDSFNAQNTIMIKDSLSKHGKIITWAHHSHVNHNSTRMNIPSMGQRLKEIENNNVYTIGCFAGHGKVLFAKDDWLFPILALGIKPKTDIENTFLQLHEENFFLDTKTVKHNPALQKYFSANLTTRMEKYGVLTTRLYDDFDGVIFCSEVSPPNLFLLKNIAQKIPYILGWLYQWWIVLVGILLVLITYKVRRGKRKVMS